MSDTLDLCHDTTLGGVMFGCITVPLPDGVRGRHCTGDGTIAGVAYDCSCACHVLPTIDPTAPGLPLPSVDPAPYLPVEPADRFMRQIPQVGEPMCGAEAPSHVRRHVREVDPTRVAFTTCHLPPHDGNRHIGQVIGEGTGLFSRLEYTWIDE